MTKEEILFKCVTSWSDEFTGWFVNDVLKAMDEYTKQESIEFKSYCDKYIGVPKDNNELFESYLQSKQK